MLKLPSLTALARGMSRRSNRVPLLALLLAGVLSAFLTVQLVDARRQQENLARQEARNLAALLEARLLAGIREIDVALRSVSPRLNPVSLRHNPMPANARLVAEHALEQALPLAGFADHLGLMNVRGELIYQTGRHPELLEAMSREYFIRMRDDPGLKFFGTRLLVSSDQRSSGIVLARRAQRCKAEGSARCHWAPAREGAAPRRRQVRRPARQDRRGPRGRRPCQPSLPDRGFVDATTVHTGPRRGLFR